MWSVTTRPSTASPRNSRRSLEWLPGFSAHQERWATARASSSGSAKLRPSRSTRAATPSAGSGSGRSELGNHVVDRVADGLQVLEVLVLDAEADRPLAELLFEGLDQLDEGQGVGVEVLAKGGRLGDGVRLDLEDVGQPVADQLEDLLAVHRGPLHVG